MKTIDGSSAAFLLAANDRLTAGAYEEMLKKNNIGVTLESREQAGGYAVIMGYGGAGGAAAPVNIYVPADQLERARELVDAFENEPVVYKTPPPASRASQSRRFVFAFFMSLIFGAPICISLYVIIGRVIRFFSR